MLDVALIRRMPGLGEFLEVMLGGDPQSILLARIIRRNQAGITLSALIAETGWHGKTIEQHLAGPEKQGQIIRFGDRFVHASAVEDLKLLIGNTLADFHRNNPLVPGMSKEELRERVKASGEVMAAAMEILVRDKQVEVEGEIARLPGRGVVMKSEEAESKKTIETAFASAGLKVPALKDVLAGLTVDRSRAHKIVTLLLRDKILVKISEDLVFHRDALKELRQRMASEKTKSPNIDVARFKDLAGVSRKYAIPLLEYLDREHVTRRVGDRRVIL